MSENNIHLCLLTCIFRKRDQKHRHTISIFSETSVNTGASVSRDELCMFIYDPSIPTYGPLCGVSNVLMFARRACA
jgi:hypothetical protein